MTQHDTQPIAQHNTHNLTQHNTQLSSKQSTQLLGLGLSYTCDWNHDLDNHTTYDAIQPQKLLLLLLLV